MLTRDGVLVELSPTYVEMLAYLASHAGQLFSKAALMDRFWPDVAVMENALEQAIAAIRRALEDNATRPRFVQTLPRQGYRFIAAVDVSGAPEKPDLFVEWTKGRVTLERFNREQLGEATAAFERALADDASYAPTYVALANAYFLQFEVTRPENSPNWALLECAVSRAKRATELDPKLSEAWATLAFVLTGAGDGEYARAAARKATMLRPDSWRHFFRFALACWGEERLENIDRMLAMKRDFAPLYFIAAMVWVARQDFHKAEELAAKGAELQSRGAQEEWMLPAFGLHWLRGLLQLRSGDVAAAVASFDREINEGCQTSIYYREYRVNALLGKGYAHLAAGDAEVAAHAFQSVLGSMPTNARALLGLQRVADRRGRVSEAESLLARVHDSLAELTKGGRLVEAALVRASIDAARGADEHASEILQRLLKNAPPGQAGWSIPIDPAFAPLREAPCFARVLTSLSSRAS